MLLALRFFQGDDGQRISERNALRDDNTSKEKLRVVFTQCGDPSEHKPSVPLSSCPFVKQVISHKVQMDLVVSGRGN